MILTHDMLSPAQKKWVFMVKLFHPEIKDRITFDQIHAFHLEFSLLRKKDPKYKIGLPNWLIQNNRIERGLYFFPAEGNTYQEETEAVDELDMKYRDYLSLYHLTPV